MFGISDGIHLIYAGEKYSDLDKSKFRLFFRAIIYISLIMCVLFLLIIFFFVENPDRAFALFFIGLNIIIFNINGFFTHVNQVTSRFQYYSWGIVLDRILFVVTIIPMFFLPLDSYKYYIIVNFVSRVAVIFFNISTAKDLVFGNSLILRKSFQEIIELIKAGIPLTLSGIFAMLLIGYPRMIVDKFFGVEQFGLFSFANSLLSIAIQLVIALSIVLYPMLRRVEERKREKYHTMLNKTVWIFGSCMLCVYFPLVFILNNYLPNYSPILDYLFLLFPMMIYQCKNNIVLTTFYKTLRLERKMLTNNIIGLIINFVVTIITYHVFGSILSIVAASVFCFAVWTYFTEWYLNKKCNWLFKQKHADFYIIIGFLLSTQIPNWILGLFVYLFILICIGLLFRRSLLEWYSIGISIFHNKKEKY